MNTKDVLARWGWAAPRPETVAQAELVQKIRGDVARALEELGVLDGPTVAGLKTTCPSGTSLLDFAVKEQQGRVQPHVEKVMALAAGYPFYDQLGILENHTGMAQPGAISRCETLDCALMLIEAARPVIVFASFTAMLQFSMMGRIQRESDPLLAAANTIDPLLAVGSRDDISAIISQYRGGRNLDAAQSDNVWNSNSPETKDHPEQRELARLLDHAIDNKASDIALVPMQDGSCRILMRQFGNLVPPRIGASWDSALASQVIQVLESKSGANPALTAYRAPRDGHISYRSSVGEAFLRTSFMPLNQRGEVKPRKSVSIRLFSNSESRIDLKALDLPAEVEEAIENCIRTPAGLLLLVGPMNSGKSSTIAAAMGLHAKIYGSTKKRISVEDPVERKIADVTQVEVPPSMQDAAGNPISDNERFNTILSGSKRHDINVYWVGEVRDAQSAGFCVSVASSGHLALSTLHAKNSILGFDILSKMVNADMRFQLAESLALIISQRLVPRLCPHCKKACKPTSAEKKQWQLYMQMEGDSQTLPGAFYKAASNEESGCKKCVNGYWGNAAVCEVLPFTRAVRDAATELLDGGSKARAAREQMAALRTLTLIQSAVRHLKSGNVDFPSIINL